MGTIEVRGNSINEKEVMNDIKEAIKERMSRNGRRQEEIIDALLDTVSEYAMKKNSFMPAMYDDSADIWDMPITTHRKTGAPIIRGIKKMLRYCVKLAIGPLIYLLVSFCRHLDDRIDQLEEKVDSMNIS